MTRLGRLGASPPVGTRLLPLVTGRPRLVGWLGPLAVGLLAFFLRVWHVGYPNKILFDETYYAKGAYSLLQFGYVQDYEDKANKAIAHGHLTGLFTGQPTEIVHPNAAKWLMAAGEHLFGMDAFGWRIASVVVGALTVVVLARLVRRLTGSTLLGCLAGLLLCFDGMHFVMSRLALLDVFLAFWLVCAVACLVADRDWGRARLAARFEHSGDITGFGPVRGLLWRPWRVGAGLCFGMAAGTKWNAVWVIAVFGILTYVWDAHARRAIGVRGAWLKSALVDGIPAFGLIVGVAFCVYLANWTGWMVNHAVYEQRFGMGYGDMAPWGSYVNHRPDGFTGQVWNALRSLWHYHQMVYDFHTGSYLAHQTHPYGSDPAGWLVLNRPVGVDAQNDLARSTAGCTAAAGDTCMRQILILGNPVLWWTGAAALLASVWAWLRDRDWRYVVPLVALAATWIPWFAFDDRPIFSFYMVAAIPFTVVAIVLVIGRLLRKAEARPERPWRRRCAVIGVGLYLAAVIGCFAFFYPIYTDTLISHTAWTHRMWFSRWV